MEGNHEDSDFKLDVGGFEKAEIKAQDIKDKLARAHESRIMTGVSVMDSVFGGLLPADMVLLGAKTGAGKTSLASDIALYNSQKEKKVYVFALEAEKNEIQMRIIYSLLVKKAKSFNPRARYNFKHWMLGYYEDLNCFYDECLAEVNNFKNLYIFYRTKKFTPFDLVREIMAVKDDADLIILDHIHYIDLEGDNENKAMSEAIRDLREVNLRANIPFIVIAHLRKGAGLNKLVPELDDFMGSSDLTKVCTKGVILAPGDFNKGKSETYFYFPKFRFFSAPTQYLFKCDFDLSNHKYSKEFCVAKFSSNSQKFNFMEHIVDHKEKLSWLD